MQFGRKAAIFAATSIFLALSAGAASAVPAQATGSVNVRTGPGAGYSKVDTLHRGEFVDVMQCQSGWCYIAHSGPDGWVSANFLGRNGSFYPGRSQPDVSIQFNVPGFGFSFGTPQPDPWPRPIYHHPRFWPRY